MFDHALLPFRCMGLPQCCCSISTCTCSADCLGDPKPSTPMASAFLALCRAGSHRVVFLERGSFILVMASAQGEPDTVLLRQLSLIHSQIISILSSSVEKMFARNPSYDVRKLLGRHAPVTDSVRPAALRCLALLGFCSTTCSHAQPACVCV